MVCTNTGCVAQIEADVNAIARLKKGKNALHSGLQHAGQAVMTLSLPLAEFAQAYDGPPADQKQVEEQNKKLIEELQKRARQQSSSRRRRRAKR